MNWLLTEYVLDAIAIMAAGRRVVDVLLLVTISQANNARVTSNIELQTAFADAATPPPDALKRPITTHALAQSLRMPFETVRRRVHALEKAGLCALIDGGIVVPAAPLMSAEFVGRAARLHDRSRSLYQDVKRYGALPPLPERVVELPTGMVPFRLAARTSADLILRMIDSMTERTGAVLFDAILLLAMMRANLAHLAPSVAGTAAWADDGFFEDGQRRPARPAHLAAQTGFPAETVRRHARWLQEAGFCTATPQGLLVNQDGLSSPVTRPVMQTNLANLDRMFAQLAEAGVLALWDQQEEAGLAAPAT